jgi:hypothetical protein
VEKFHIGEIAVFKKFARAVNKKSLTSRGTGPGRVKHKMKKVCRSKNAENDWQTILSIIRERQTILSIKKREK